MFQKHPFDATLGVIDPETHRLTTEELALLGDDKLNVTLLSLLPSLEYIDLEITDADSAYRYRVTSPIQYSFIGPGLGQEGAFEPYTMAAEPCHCPVAEGDEPRWNPLSLALVWHPGLQSIRRRIFIAYIINIAENIGQYCEDGITLMSQFALS